MSAPINVLYAHTLANRDETEWEPLNVHLTSTAEMAERCTSVFTAVGWGSVLGRCHDLGKASAEFQAKLRAANPREARNAGMEDSAIVHRVDHSTFGARYVKEHAGPIVGELLAYCIAGHHAGLPDGKVTEDASSKSTLEVRLDSARIALPRVADPGLVLPPLEMRFHPSAADMPFALAFFTRMLFSCLIDADRTCTERFCDPEQAAQRRVLRPSIANLESALHIYLDSMMRTAPVTEVNRQRAFVLQQCQLASTGTPGFFSLQVPTGGGKTLSSLAFALAHAQVNGLRRVVIAIPFTSIIEQTAEVYRRALGPLAEHGLVEHHTDLKPENETRENQFATEIGTHRSSSPPTCGCSKAYLPQEHRPAASCTGWRAALSFWTKRRHCLSTCLPPHCAPCVN